MKKIVSLLETILKSPIFAGVIAFIAIAFTVGGRFSTALARLFLWMAWGAAVFGLYRAEILIKISPLRRWLMLGLGAILLAIGTILLGKWFVQQKLEPSQDAQHDQMLAPGPTSTLPNPHQPSNENTSVVANDYVPQIALIYQNKRVEIHNYGKTNLYLWGSEYGGAKIPLDGEEPRVIAPSAFYYLFMNDIEDQLRIKIGSNGEKMVSFRAFITTEDSNKHTIRGILLGRVTNGEVSIHTQVLPTLEGWKQAESVEDNSDSIDKTIPSSSQAQQQALPNVALRFVHPKIPAVILDNSRQALARDIKWSVILWNVDLPDRNDPLPIPSQSFDWLRPGDSGGPQNIFHTDLVAPLVKPGDRLIGSASVICPNCEKGHTYVVSIVFNQGGWFAEVKSEDSGHLIIPRKFDPEARKSLLQQYETLIPAEDRIPIKDWP